MADSSDIPILCIMETSSVYKQRLYRKRHSVNLFHADSFRVHANNALSIIRIYIHIIKLFFKKKIRVRLNDTRYIHPHPHDPARLCGRS